MDEGKIKMAMLEIANRHGKSHFVQNATEAALRNGLVVVKYSTDPTTGEMQREVIRPEEFFKQPDEATDGQG